MSTGSFPQRRRSFRDPSSSMVHPSSLRAASSPLLNQTTPVSLLLRDFRPASTVSGRKSRRLVQTTLTFAAIIYFSSLIVTKLFYPDSILSVASISIPSYASHIPTKSNEYVMAKLVRRKVQTAATTTKRQDAAPERTIEQLERAAKMVNFRNEILLKDPDLPLDVRVIRETEKHTATVIFLHGLGQDSNSSPLHSALAARLPSVRWVLPAASLIPVTVLDGKVTRAWFDMTRFPHDSDLPEDERGMFAATRDVNSVIRHEISELIQPREDDGSVRSSEYSYKVQLGSRENGESAKEREMASTKIVIAGFSQGGVTALLSGLTAEYPLAGIAVISGFLPIKSKISAIIEDLDRSTPIFFGHGKKDDILLYTNAVDSIDRLESLGQSAVEFHSYDNVRHTHIAPEIDHIGDWLDQILPSDSIVDGEQSVKKSNASAARKRNKRMAK